jgi:hypothetical protein
MADQDGTWWYEDAGRQAGPVTTETLGRLLAEGRVSPAHRVWRNGMAGWEQMNRVAELAPILAAQAAPGAPRAPALPPPPFPPPAVPPAAPAAHPPSPYAAPGPGRPAATVSPAAFEEIPVAVTLVLAVVTFGIYGLLKFFQTGKGYEQLAGRPSRFTTYFWLFIGLGVAGIVLNGATGVLGIPLGIASAVFQVLTLNEALQVREEGMRQHRIGAPVTSASTHRVLLILAIVFSFVLVGVVFAVIQAVKWFRDWNAVGAALRGGARA